MRTTFLLKSTGIFFLLLCMICITGYVKGQSSWQTGTSTLWTNPDGTKVGIGTNAPAKYLHIQAVAISGIEGHMRISNADAPEDFLDFQNVTSVDNQFVGAIRGHHQTDNRQSFYLMATTDSANDDETSTSPLMQFDVRVLSDKFSSGGSKIEKRPLFQFTNLNSPLMTFLPDVNTTTATKALVGINTASPTSDLDIDGEIRIRGGVPLPGRVLVSTDALGNAEWQDPGALSLNNWSLIGNVGTNPMVNFLGTIDNQDLVFRTFSTQRMTILGNTGQVAIGAAGPTGTELLFVNGDIKTNASFIASDARFKKNIHTVEGALDKVLRLNGVDYYFNQTAVPSRNFGPGKQIGFIAQEVKEIIPEVVNLDDEGYYSINYIALIPVLTEAIKEQQAVINQQAKDLEDLKSKMDALLLSNGTILTEDTNDALLFQNEPNPFNQSTTIKYYIPENAGNQNFIFIYDLQGKQVKKYSVQKGQGAVIVQSNELPAGMYIYNLVIDNKEVSSKKMILRN